VPDRGRGGLVVPVIILTRMPARAQRSIASAASGRGGSIRPARPRKVQPSAHFHRRPWRRIRPRRSAPCDGEHTQRLSARCSFRRRESRARSRVERRGFAAFVEPPRRARDEHVGRALTTSRCRFDAMEGRHELVARVERNSAIRGEAACSAGGRCRPSARAPKAPLVGSPTSSPSHTCESQHSAIGRSSGASTRDSSTVIRLRPIAPPCTEKAASCEPAGARSIWFASACPSCRSRSPSCSPASRPPTASSGSRGFAPSGACRSRRHGDDCGEASGIAATASATALIAASVQGLPRSESSTKITVRRRRRSRRASCERVELALQRVWSSLPLASSGESTHLGLHAGCDNDISARPRVTTVFMYSRFTRSPREIRIVERVGPLADGWDSPVSAAPRLRGCAR